MSYLCIRHLSILSVCVPVYVCILPLQWNSFNLFFFFFHLIFASLLAL